MWGFGVPWNRQREKVYASEELYRVAPARRRDAPQLRLERAYCRGHVARLVKGDASVDM